MKPTGTNHGLMPHNQEAEQGLLGSLLVDNRVLEVVSEIITADDFFLPVHGRIYTAIQHCAGSGRIASPVTLKNNFEDDPDLKQRGGAIYLAELAAEVMSVINSKDYAVQLRELSRRRQLIGIAEQMRQEAWSFDLETDAEKVLDSAEQKLFNLAEAGIAGAGPQNMNEVVDKTTALIERIQKGQHSGLKTGIRALDEVLDLQPGQLVTIAGRPAMGKTAFSLTLARNMASLGRNVLFFSMEMGVEELTQRLIARKTGLPSGMQMREGALKQEHWRSIAEATGELRALPLHIDETAGLSVHQIRTRARQHKRKFGLDVVFIDYLGLMNMADRYNSLTDQLGEAARALKVMAKDIGIPVLLLHQINRGVEGREDKRPALSDLRDSGKIEEHSDIVVFLYRDEYYLERAEPRRKPSEDEDKFASRSARFRSDLEQAHGVAEALIAKYRQGRTCDVKMKFNGPRQVFHDFDTAD
ncbi:MAG: replicative DNA helicase [Alphaproteobacteria bacterium]